MARGEGGGPPKGSKNAYGAGSPKQEIAKWGEKTRFGSENGPDPKEAGRNGGKSNGGGIRAHLKTLMESPIFAEDPSKLKLSDFAKLFGLRRVSDLTFGHISAIQFFKQGLGNGKVMMALIDNVDGKLVQKNENKDTTSWADMLAKAYGGEGEAEDDGS